ncbi:MAG: NAD-dependent epimerase/dehydratase family protein [Dongiaceae bacterium]
MTQPRDPDIAGSRIFITGGAGFIGTHLAARLADRNEVVLFDNLHNSAGNKAPVLRHRNVRLAAGDVRDIAAVRAALDPGVEYVIHAAAIAGVDTVIADPMRVLEVNVKGTFNVAEAAQGLRGLKRFVGFSTSEVFGNHAYDVSERDIKPTLTVGEPRWTYAMSKLVGEFVVHAHGVRDRMPAVTLRPFNVYGPNQAGVGAVHNFVRRALAGEAIVVHGEGAQIRAWCYVDDFVQGALAAMSSDTAIGRTYNIGDPRSTVTVLALARMIAALAGSRSAIVLKPIDYPDIGVRVPNIGAARRDLGYEPTIELEDGLRRTIEWYRSSASPAGGGT